MSNVPSPEDIRKKLLKEDVKFVNQTLREENENLKLDIIRLKAEIILIKSEKEKTREQMRREMQAEMGQRGKKTPLDVRMSLEKYLEANEIEPAEELIRMATEKDDQGRFLLSPDQRIKILLDLNQYRMPKLKAIENTGTINHDHRVIIVKYGDKIPIENHEGKPVSVPIDMTGSEKDVKRLTFDEAAIDGSIEITKEEEEMQKQIDEAKKILDQKNDPIT